MATTKKNIATHNEPVNTGNAGLKGQLLKWAPYIILLFTALLYSKAIFNELLAFDDSTFIYDNALVKGGNFLKIFTTFADGKYQPLTTISFALEYKLFGFNPMTFHITNILLHLCSTFLVFKIAERLSKNRITAIVMSLLFAIHPMHVEEVAWASERKDMLYALFYLLSVFFYLRYTDGGYKLKYYIATAGCFLLAVFSKTEAVTLPLLLVVIDVYRSRKIAGKALWEKLPLLAFSVFIFILGMLSRSGDGALEQITPASYGFINRVFLFTTIPAFYIVKLIAPFHLSAMHYYPDMHNGLLPWPYYASLPFMLFMGWVVFRRSALRKELLFGAVFFAVTICVMPQLISVGPALTPERYSYIPYIGLFYIIGQWMAKVALPKWQAVAVAVFSVFVSICCVFTWVRIGVWKNSMTIFTDVIEKNSDVADCSYFYLLRGNVKVADNDLRSAIEDYDTAIQQHPRYIEAYGNRATASFQGEDMPAALADYNEALRLSPNHAQYYYNRAATKASMNDLPGALSDYNKFLEYRPEDNAAYTDRGMVRLGLTDTAGACQDWHKAASLGNEKAQELVQEVCR
jgi:hypothetical protein